MGVSIMWSRSPQLSHGGLNIKGLPLYFRRCLEVAEFHEDVYRHEQIPKKSYLVFSRHPVCIPDDQGPAMDGSSAPIDAEIR